MDSPTSLARRSESADSTAPVTALRVPTQDRPPAEQRLKTYLQAVVRRWPIVAATALAAVALAFGYARSLPLLYEASARVLVEAQAPNVVTFTPVQEEGSNVEFYTTQLELLRSRALAERTIERLGLWSHPELAGEGGGTGASARARAVSVFLNHLEVSQVKQSRLVQIAFVAEDPELAARVANTHAATFIDRSLEERVRPSTDAAASLERLLDEQKRQVDASEEALQRYRERHGNVSLEEEGNVTQQKLLQLTTAMTTARAARIQKGSLYEQLRAIQESKASIDTFPAFLSNGFIQNLKSDLMALQSKQAQLTQQLGELHPDMVQLRTAIASAEAKLKSEIAKAAEAVRNEYEAAQAGEKALARAVAEQQREVLARDRASIEYANLQRSAATTRKMYDSLLQRSKETAVAGSIQSGTVRLVDRAEIPSVPEPRGERMYAVLAVFWGGALGVGVVFLLQAFDSRLRSWDDVVQHLALPCVGCAPPLEKAASLTLLGDGIPPEFTEALRSIGATLLGSPNGVAQSLLVTSATAGEGKTLVAGHLALALARTGQRVALIDADLRRPRMHEFLAMDRGPGLADLLAGAAPLRDAIRKSPTRGLWLVPAGDPTQSPDVLSTERLPQLVAQLTEAFDWVIVDSPPVLAAADTTFLAKAAAEVFLVVNAASARREVVQDAIERLEAVGAAPMGVVLNRARPRHKADYYHDYSRPHRALSASAPPPPWVPGGQRPGRLTRPADLLGSGVSATWHAAPSHRWSYRPEH